MRRAPALVGFEDRRGHLRRHVGTSGSREIRQEKKAGKEKQTLSHSLQPHWILTTTQMGLEYIPPRASRERQFGPVDVLILAW